MQDNTKQNPLWVKPLNFKVKLVLCKWLTICFEREEDALQAQSLPSHSCGTGFPITALAQFLLNEMELTILLCVKLHFVVTQI